MSTHVVLGTGTIGSTLANYLATDGHTVRAVNRSGARGALDPAVSLTSGDITNPVFAASALAGADVVYQVTQPAYHRWAGEFPALQDAVLNAAEAAGASVVLADNLYCYGDPGTTITEATPEIPASTKGEIRKAMSDDALARHAAGRVRVALSRPSNYVGADYEVFRDLIIARLRGGKPAQILGSADQPHSFSYADDVARAMAAIGTSDKGWGRAWVAPTMEPITQRDLLTRLWVAAGHEGDPRFSALSGLPMRMLGLFMPALGASIEMMYEWDKPFIADSAQFEATFGFGASSWDDVIAGMAGALRVA